MTKNSPFSILHSQLILALFLSLLTLNSCGCIIKKVLKESKEQFVSGMEQQLRPLVWSFTGGPKTIDKLTEADFHEGLAVVYVDGRYGFADESLNMAIAAEYDDACNFSEGLAAVAKNGKWGFIDATGKVVLKFAYTRVATAGFQNGIIFVTYREKDIFINKKGKKIKINKQ